MDKTRGICLIFIIFSKLNVPQRYSAKIYYFSVYKILGVCQKEPIMLENLQRGGRFFGGWIENMFICGNRWMCMIIISSKYN